MSASAAASNTTADGVAVTGTRAAHPVAVVVNATTSIRRNFIPWTPVTKKGSCVLPPADGLVEPLGVALLDVALVVLEGHISWPDLIEQHTCHRRQRIGRRPRLWLPEARTNERLRTMQEALLDLDTNRDERGLAVSDATFEERRVASDPCLAVYPQRFFAAGNEEDEPHVR